MRLWGKLARKGYTAKAGLCTLRLEETLHLHATGVPSHCLCNTSAQFLAVALGTFGGKGVQGTVRAPAVGVTSGSWKRLAWNRQ